MHLGNLRVLLAQISPLHDVIKCWWVCVVMFRYNGEWELGREALEDILYRAQLELYSQPLLVRPTAKKKKKTYSPESEAECFSMFVIVIPD